MKYIHSEYLRGLVVNIAAFGVMGREIESRQGGSEYLRQRRGPPD
jgi:hypothetical protein